MIYGEKKSNKCFYHSGATIFAPDGPGGFLMVYVMLTCESHNVRYANYLPVYYSITSFDRTFEMACSTSDSSLDFYSKIIYYSKTNYY